MKKLMIVSDWAEDSLTTAEVRSAIEGFLENPSNPNITVVSSTPSTVHTAFIINQLVETEERYGRPLDTVIFQASDPALENEGEALKSWGELLIIRLKSGLHIIGPNAGFSFSMIKSRIEAVFRYPGLSESGSFRVRDIFARVVSHLMDSKQDDLDLEETYTNLIPELENHYVAYVDSFGNIITSIPESVIEEKYSYGNEITLTLNGVTKQARYVKSLFDGDIEELIIYPGTTGNPDDPFLEISKYVEVIENKTTGSQEFNYPVPGVEIYLK